MTELRACHSDALDFSPGGGGPPENRRPHWGNEEPAAGVTAAPRFSMAAVEVARYTRSTVDIMVDGCFVDEFDRLHDSDELENLQWARARSRIETEGRVDSDLFTGMLDLERALAALERFHPEGSLVLFAKMRQFSDEQMETAFGSMRRDWRLLLRQSTAFVAAWLSGDDAKAAWRRARRGERTPFDQARD